MLGLIIPFSLPLQVEVVGGAHDGGHVGQAVAGSSSPRFRPLKDVGEDGRSSRQAEASLSLVLPDGDIFSDISRDGSQEILFYSEMNYLRMLFFYI